MTHTWFARSASLKRHENTARSRSSTLAAGATTDPLFDPATSPLQQHVTQDVPGAVAMATALRKHPKPQSMRDRSERKRVKQKGAIVNTVIDKLTAGDATEQRLLAEEVSKLTSGAFPSPADHEALGAMVGSIGNAVAANRNVDGRATNPQRDVHAALVTGIATQSVPSRRQVELLQTHTQGQIKNTAAAREMIDKAKKRRDKNPDASKGLWQRDWITRTKEKKPLMSNEEALTVIMEAWIEWAQDSDSNGDYGRSYPGKRLEKDDSEKKVPVCEELPVLEMSRDGFVHVASEYELRRDVKWYFGGAREPSTSFRLLDTRSVSLQPGSSRLLPVA